MIVDNIVGLVTEFISGIVSGIIAPIFRVMEALNKMPEIIHKLDGDYVVVHCPKCCTPYKINILELEKGVNYG